MFNLGRKRKDGVGSSEKSERKSVFPPLFGPFRALHDLVLRFLSFATCFLRHFYLLPGGKS